MYPNKDVELQDVKLTDEVGKSHIPVMLKEVLKYLMPQDNEVYLDATFGAGGYSRAILESSNCQVVALDQDPEVAIYAKSLSAEYPSRFRYIKSNFAGNLKLLEEIKFNGIVLDLGVSSMQLAHAIRGFSFNREGPLDMRMSSTGITAGEWINNASEEEIADVIYNYGDETASRKIARKIVKERKSRPLTTTIELANLVRSCRGRQKIDAATKTFQAIRIYINDELGNLERFLAQVENILLAKGRFVAVSFHSLEDKIIKSFIKMHSEPKIAKSKYKKILQNQTSDKWLTSLTHRPISPNREEIYNNTSARSAKLRAAIREIK